MMGNARSIWGDGRKGCGPRNIDSLLKIQETGFFFLSLQHPERALPSPGLSSHRPHSRLDIFGNVR